MLCEQSSSSKEKLQNIHEQRKNIKNTRQIIKETRQQINKYRCFLFLPDENSRNCANIYLSKFVQDRCWSILGASGAQKTGFKHNFSTETCRRHFLCRIVGRPWSSRKMFFELFSMTCLGVCSVYIGVYTPSLLSAPPGV